MIVRTIINFLLLLRVDKAFCCLGGSGLGITSLDPDGPQDVDVGAIVEGGLAGGAGAPPPIGGEPFDYDYTYEEYGQIDEASLIDEDGANGADGDWPVGDNEPGSGGPEEEIGAEKGPEEPGSGGPDDGGAGPDDGGEGEGDGEDAIGGQDQGQGTAATPSGGAVGGQDEGQGTPGPGQGAGVGGPSSFEGQRGEGGVSGGNECGLGGSSKDKFYGNCGDFKPSPDGSGTDGTGTGGDGDGTGTDGGGTDGTGTGTDGTDGTGTGTDGTGTDGTGTGTDGTGPDGTGTAGPDEAASAALIALLLGVEVTYGPHDPSFYNEMNGGPVVVEGELDCDVDNNCCWHNAQPPTDALEFQVGEGKIDPALLQSTFGVDTPPDGKFLVAVSAGENPMYEAQMISCSIVCTNEPVTVAMTYWASNDVQIQVCSREAFFNHPELNPLLHCVDLPKDGAPGPAKAVLPPGEMFDIVIVVRNFASSSGDAVILDNIRVDYVLCPEAPVQFTTTGLQTTPAVVTTEPATEPPTTEEEITDEPVSTDEPTTEPPTTEIVTTELTTPVVDTDAECLAIECDFEDGTMCSYTTVAVEGLPRTFFKGPIQRMVSEKQMKGILQLFKVHEGRIYNYVTGIYEAAQGTKYAAVYLKSKNAAVIRTEYVFTEKRVIRAKYYEATAAFDMNACCFTKGKPRCRKLRPKKIAIGDREWKTIQFTCEADTSEIYFLCSSKKSKNQGACGLDDIRLYVYDESIYVEDDTTVELQAVCL